MKPKDYFIIFKSKYKNQATVYEQKPDSKKAMLVTHVREVQADDQNFMTALIKKTEERVWREAADFCRGEKMKCDTAKFNTILEEGKMKGYLT